MIAGKPEPLVIHGWTIFAHPLFLAQVEALPRQVETLKQKDPAGYLKKNASKRLAAITKLAFDVIPQDPARVEYRQGGRSAARVLVPGQVFPAVPTILPLPCLKQGDRLRLGERRRHQTRL